MSVSGLSAIRVSVPRVLQPSPRSAAKPSLRLPRSLLWLATAAMSGGIIMSLELVAFRLYAPYFGYSIYVWGSIIAVVMAALAGGYTLGGWIADRSRSDLPLYVAILGSAAYQLLIVYTIHPLLSRLSNLGEVVGVALATLITFAPSMTGLAATGPYVIGMLGRAGYIGLTSGRVHALSTAGSILGVLATTLILVPHFGTRATLNVACLLTFTVGASGLLDRRRSVLAGLVLLAAVPLIRQQAPWPAGTVWQSESAYNLVRVVRRGPMLLLTLNEQGSVHTVRVDNSDFTGRYYDDFALGPLLAPAGRVLVLGMGGGGSIRATRLTAPSAGFDAVEIDPKVVEAAERFFAVRPEEGRVAIHVADARRWVARSTDRFDIVHVDLYHGGPYVPFYLMTEEFFRSVRARMNPDGLLMMNLFDVSQDQELLLPAVQTLKSAFASVLVLPRGNGNFILLAFPEQRALNAVRAQLQAYRTAGPIRKLARDAARELEEITPSAATEAFTDDHAPVEEITRRMLAEYRAN